MQNDDQVLISRFLRKEFQVCTLICIPVLKMIPNSFGLEEILVSDWFLRGFTEFVLSKKFSVLNVDYRLFCFDLKKMISDLFWGYLV